MNQRRSFDLTSADAPQQALHSVGFEPFSGQRSAGIASTVPLSLHFARRTLRGFFSIAVYASFLILPIIAAGWIVARSLAGEFIDAPGLALPPGTEVAFALDTAQYLFAGLCGWAMVFNGFFVAPLIRRDVREGALLLYFCRPVRRADYLVARFAAPAALTTFAFGVSAILIVAALIQQFGAIPPDVLPPTDVWRISGAATWPALWLFFTLAGAVASIPLAIAAHGASTLARTDGQSSLVYLGVIVASVWLSRAVAAAWGQGLLVSALDLYAAIGGIWQLLGAALDPAPVPSFALQSAALGLGTWVLVAVIAGRAVQQLVWSPPASRDRQ